MPISDSLIGPEPAQAKLYAQALSTAFFQTHLANRSEYKTYLSAAYAKSLAQPLLQRIGRINVTRANNLAGSLQLNLVRASAAESIVQVLQQDNALTRKLVP